MKNGGTRFLQSAGDFPMMVRLGSREPLWELTRWGRDRLGFAPLEEEGFITRGDKRRLVYQGRRRSHRFTVLDSQRFEYDVILNREPESNRICLALEGWEEFDFFRQPDNLGPEILRGSYAVYKKETVINSPAYHVGTGKLCHIHRPRVIDDRGRWTWGDIRIDRGTMTLTVPEWWLGEAAYPVTVDPVVGSSTVGAYATYKYISAEEYEWYLEDRADDPSLEMERYTSDYPVDFSSLLACNKYKAPWQLQGTYNAYAYINTIVPPSKFNKPMVCPVLYSDLNNRPKYLLVYDNTMGDPLANAGNPGSFTPRWTQATLTVNGSVAADTDVWFGFWGDSCGTRFDYGAPFFLADLGTNPFEDREKYASVLELAYAADFYDVGIFDDILADSPYRVNVYPGARYDLKMSVYLAIPAVYTRMAAQGAGLTDARKTAAGYNRTLAQGAAPTEGRKQAGNYRRNAAQTAGGAAVTKRFEGFCRNLVQAVSNTVMAKGPLALLRTLTQQAGAGVVFGRWLSMLRKPAQTAGAGGGTQRIAQAKRSVTDAGKLTAMTGWKQDFMRAIAHWGVAAAGVMRKAGYAKRFQDTAANRDGAGAARNLALRLAEAAAALYGMKAAGGFDRRLADTAGAGSVTGGMGRFFRVLSGVGGGGDSAGRFVARLRVVRDTETAGDAAGRTAEYLRGLFVEAGALAGNRHTAGYERGVAEYADIEAVPLRHLSVFIRLVTGAYIRDFIIGRFLKSREEAVMKSPVCRELRFDSALH